MNLLQMSLSAGIMIIAITVVRALAINRLPKKTFLVLWGIALIRLLLPFSFPSPLSVYSLANRAGIAEPTTNFPAVNMPVLTAPQIAEYAPGNTAGAAPVPVWMVVWGMGAILCALYFVISYLNYRRGFMDSLPVENAFAAEWLAGRQLKRHIEIRQSNRIKAPLTYGFLHPVILMPKHTDWSDTQKLQYVLQHEYVHILRFDTATKILLAGALCMHWFNPLVWAMYLLANRDLELSCDESVVRSFGATIKSAYALALISMEEQKSGFIPFCNNFSKNAIEERIKAIMKMKKTSAMAVLAAFALIVAVTASFATSAAAANLPLAAIPDTDFSQAEFDQLLELRFDGYEKLTVAEYQEKVWTLTDNADSKLLLERVSQDAQLLDMRYTNDTASWLLNTLIPLTAEKWQTSAFGGYAEGTDADGRGDHAVLEYQVVLTILDATHLSVGEYEQARQGVMDGLQRLLQGKSITQLQDESGMNTIILAEIEALKSKWESSFLEIGVEYRFMPLSMDAASSSDSNNGEGEPRRYAAATQADYQSLLKLKTEDYRNQPVAAFNEALLDWANVNFERSERISGDAAGNDFQALLTDEERAFVTLTAQASGEENAVLVQSLYTGGEKKDPVLGNFYLTKEENDNTRAALANLFYQLTYHITDEKRLTVGERDYALAGVINGIQQYWDNADINTLIAMDAEKMLKELKTIAADYSTELIEISFVNDTVHFEGMTEPIKQ